MSSEFKTSKIGRNGRIARSKRIQDFEDWQERKDSTTLLRAVEKKMRAQRAEEQNFEPAELKAKEAKSSTFGPQGGFASGRFHNYWVEDLACALEKWFGTAEKMYTSNIYI